jgi:hypothetical protein
MSATSLRPAGALASSAAARRSPLLFGFARPPAINPANTPRARGAGEHCRHRCPAPSDRGDGAGRRDPTLPPLAARAAVAARRPQVRPLVQRPGPAGHPGGPLRGPHGGLRRRARRAGPRPGAVRAVGQRRGAGRRLLARRVAPHHAGPPALHRVRAPPRGAAPGPAAGRAAGEPRRPRPRAAGAGRRPAPARGGRGERAVAGDGAGAGGPRRRGHRGRAGAGRGRAGGTGRGGAARSGRAAAAHDEAGSGDPAARAGGGAAHRRRGPGDRLPRVRPQVRLRPRRVTPGSAALPGPAQLFAPTVSCGLFRWREGVRDVS